MTENKPPISVPSDLVERWKNEPEYTDGRRKITMVTLSRERLQEIADRSAQWGSDQELEACCEWLKDKEWIHPEFGAELHDFRRPKPPSLKEQALQALKRAEEGWRPIPDDCDTIRRALEMLPD